jgi:hypothetical protein
MSSCIAVTWRLPKSRTSIFAARALHDVRWRRRGKNRGPRKREDAVAHPSPPAQGRAMLDKLAEEVARDFAGRIVIAEDLTELEV